jgi:hypothetical protein
MVTCPSQKVTKGVWSKLIFYGRDHLFVYVFGHWADSSCNRFLACHSMTTTLLHSFQGYLNAFYWLGSCPTYYQHQQHPGAGGWVVVYYGTIPPCSVDGGGGGQVMGSLTELGWSAWLWVSHSWIIIVHMSKIWTTLHRYQLKVEAMWGSGLTGSVMNYCKARGWQAGR